MDPDTALKALTDNRLSWRTVKYRPTAPVMFDYDGAEGKEVVLTAPLAGRARDIGAMLSTNTVLRKIDLRRNMVTDEGAERIGAALKRANRTLASIDCAHNLIGSKGATAIGQALAARGKLTELNLSHNAILSAGCRRLAEGMASSPLKVLVLAGCGIEGGGAANLATVLNQNCALTDLNLSGNEIAGGAVQIAHALVRNNKLRALRLQAVGVGQKFATELGRMLETNSTLTLIDLTNNALDNTALAKLADGLVSNRGLRSLILRRNAFGDDGVVSIAGAIVAHKALRHLDVAGNNVTDEGVQQMATTLSAARQCRLRDLDLAANRLFDAAATALAGLLRANTAALTSLNLRDNFIGAEGAEALCDALRCNRALETLYLSDLRRVQAGDTGQTQCDQHGGETPNWSIMQSEPRIIIN